MDCSLFRARLKRASADPTKHEAASNSKLNSERVPSCLARDDTIFVGVLLDIRFSSIIILSKGIFFSDFMILITEEFQSES